MKLDNALLGYVRIFFNKEDQKRVLNRLILANLSGKIYDNSYIEVPLLRLKKYKSCLLGIKTSQGDVMGLPAVIMKLKKRYGFILGIVVCVIYFLLVSGVVWDVRVEAEDGIVAQEVYDELYDAGLNVGSSWRALPLDEVENRVLMNSERIAWLNINRRGNVAYVTVGEKKAPTYGESGKAYCNIIAAEDAVIEEISVKKGIAMVKAGDTVKAGQLLVSGVIPSELGGGFVHAEADISGRIYREIGIFVPRNESQTERKIDRLASVSVKIFNFAINIYKNYGNMDEEYAIIESEEYAVIPGSVKLPVGIKKSYLERSVITEKVRDDKQLISVASMRLAALRILKLGDAELIKVSSSSELSEEGIEMSSKMIVLSEIGEEKYLSPADETEE